jgi:hypothetical protein
MVRLLGAFFSSLGLALGPAVVVSHAAVEPTSDTVAWAATVDPPLDPWDLQGALNTTGFDAQTYLERIGLWSPPVPFNPQLACIEAKESGGANVWRDHTPPRFGDKPAGVLQYFDRTFAVGASELGHPEWSRWNPDQARIVGDHDLRLGRRSQWSVTGC